jgi:hypothetical protein
MYKTVLVSADIAEGQRVVDELAKVMQVTAAFWYRREEDDEWKLVIVTPDRADKGPIELYTAVAVVLNNLSTDASSPVQMPLSRITLADLDSPTYERVKRFGGSVDDVYIYKLS